MRLSLARCSRCSRRAVVWLGYARQRLCEQHLAEYVERKVERVLARVGVAGARILAAVSGGKDSSVMLAALARLREKLGFQLAVVHIDLGIPGFSEECLKAVDRLQNLYGLDCVVVRVRELLGLSVVELSRRLRRPVCSVCGMVKRWVLNTLALEAGADYVALGHTADDVIAYTFKSLVSGDLQSLSKMTPATTSVEGLLVARLRPLYEVYERETLAYTIAHRLPAHLDPCPYKPEWSFEEEVKKAMSIVEEHSPGTKIGFVRRLPRLIQHLKPPEEGELVKCSVCGGPASGSVCSFCRAVRRVGLEGSEVREKLHERAKTVKWRPPGGREEG